MLLSLTALCLLLTAGFSWIAAAGNEQTGTISAFGYRIYLNDDSSMAPAVKNHSFILAKQVDPASVENWSVITYTVREPGGRLATQTKRVMDVSPNQEGDLVFTFKGDNEESLYFIRQSEMVALSESVFSSSLLGRCLLFFYRNRTVCLVVFYLLLGLLLAGCLLLLILRGRKRYAALGEVKTNGLSALSLEELVSLEQDVVFEKSSHPQEDPHQQDPLTV